MVATTCLAGSDEYSGNATGPIATVRLIASLQVGDIVEAYNPTTSKIEPEAVRHVWINHDHDLVDVRVQTAAAAGAAAASPSVSTTTSATVATSGAHTATGQQTANADAGETIHTTANHPWLTADRGWVEAGQLRAGEPVVTLNGATARCQQRHLRR